MKKIEISVIIPIIKISKYLTEENLPAFEKQTYQNFEVLVLPNKISQNDKLLLAKYPWLKIIPTNNVSRPALKRDIGAKNSSGSVLAFIDDDAYPHPDWLKKTIDLLKNQTYGAVCGPGIIPEETNLWEKVFDAILIYPLGSAQYTYRFTGKNPRFVDDYPSMNFIIRKDLFQQLGGFNNNYWPGEDSKLCNDLVYKLKQKIYYHPDILVYHHRRNNLLGYLKQHQQYGFHRGAFFAHGDINSKRFTYIIPSFFVAYLLALLLLTVANINNKLLIVLNLPLFFYLINIIFLSVNTFFKKKLLLIALLAPPVLVITHLLYGILFVKGYFAGLINKQNIYE